MIPSWCRTMSRAAAVCRTKQPHNPRTASDEEAKVLFESYKMGPFTLANRLVYAPLTR